MKDSEVLIKAKELIASGEQMYICHAISNICTYKSNQAVDLCAWILKMLANVITYDAWIFKNHKEFGYKNHKEGRLAWLDWMILYCQTEESGGDTSKLLNSEG